MFPMRIVVLVGALAAAGALFMFPAQASEPITGPIVLVGTVSDHSRTVTFPHSERWYFSLASERRRGRPFGYGILSCTRITKRNTVRQCVGTFSLPRGKISVAGSFLYPVLYELAVTGGTGDYIGVNGVLDVRQFVGMPGSNWLTFTLR